MNKNLQKIKKTIVTLAFLLTISSSVYSQIEWTSNQLFNENKEITENILLKTDVDVYVGQDYTVIIHGKITGNQSLSKSGPGALIFTADNEYIGTTTINGGSLHFGGDVAPTGSVASKSIVINGESALIFSRKEADYSYSGVISGTGVVHKYGSGKLTLNGVNTYSGFTWLAAGTLALGPNGSIENSFDVNFTWDNYAKFDVSSGNKKIKSLAQWENFFGHEIILGESTLTIGISGVECDWSHFAGVISGSGGITKASTAELFLRGDNTYTGTTTIEEGALYLGNPDSGMGSIKSNKIINNSYFYFYTGDTEYTYPGAISGTGYVMILNKKTTLTGNNTYSGVTNIHNGATLALGSTGSIENSVVQLFNDGCKFDISAGSKKIAGLNVNAGEIALGSSTLTIDGGGWCNGKFSGTGSVTKTGAAAFLINNENTATGKFSLNGGTLEFSKEWAGNFAQAAGTNLVVKENAIIGGTCLLMGGRISMDLTQETPSKLIIMKEASTPATTSLNVKTNEITDYVLISAASGLNASAFTLGVPESVAKLSAPTDGKKLLLTAYQSMLDIESITNDELQIAVYPNPTTGQLTMDNGQLTINGVELFDVYGRKLFLRSYDLTDFPAGVYFLKITTENGIITKKIIKN